MTAEVYNFGVRDRRARASIFSEARTLPSMGLNKCSHMPVVPECMGCNQYRTDILNTAAAVVNNARCGRVPLQASAGSRTLPELVTSEMRSCERSSGARKATVSLMTALVQSTLRSTLPRLLTAATLARNAPKLSFHINSRPRASKTNAGQPPAGCAEAPSIAGRKRPSGARPGPLSDLRSARQQHGLGNC